MTQRWSAIFCATGVWGGKLIGRVRVNIEKMKYLTKWRQTKNEWFDPNNQFSMETKFDFWFA